MTRIGFKPTSVLGAGRTLNTVNDALELGAAAILAPFVRLVAFLFGGGRDCLATAR